VDTSNSTHPSWHDNLKTATDHTTFSFQELFQELTKNPWCVTLPSLLDQSPLDLVLTENVLKFMTLIVKSQDGSGAECVRVFTQMPTLKRLQTLIHRLSLSGGHEYEEDLRATALNLQALLTIRKFA